MRKLFIIADCRVVNLSEMVGDNFYELILQPFYLSGLLIILVRLIEHNIGCKNV